MPQRRRKRPSGRLRKRPQRVTRLSIVCILWLASITLLLNAFKTASSYFRDPIALPEGPVSHPLNRATISNGIRRMAAANGRPQLSPLPNVKDVWECEVVVIGGSLGGISAASQAMQAGAKTCLIELAPWLGGQVSAQGVSALDESRTMRRRQNFSRTWLAFKQLIRSQSVKLPAWTNLPKSIPVWQLNSCWVGDLCFSPRAGANSAQQWLQSAAAKAPGSRWETSTAFKGAAFDPSGKQITAIYAVKRIPRRLDYIPQGRLSRELHSWYAWSEDEVFQKIPLRLQAPAGKQLMVIDATDTGELIGWANIPYRLGSESQATTGEISAPKHGNPSCTQAFTFPFVLAIHDDGGRSWEALKQIQPGYSRAEHRRQFGLEGFPMFYGGSFFNYRRMVSTRLSKSDFGNPAPGDMTLVNWNLGNDWTWMNPPLILDEASIDASGQRQNWHGGLAIDALKEAENHALLFSEWLMETQARPEFPLAHLSGPDSPMGTGSGLSMTPYIREGRRIIGRAAYGQEQFMVREADLRADMFGGRNFDPTGVALTHYAIDIHGCRYRNWEPTDEATEASVQESLVRPLIIPLEALIPQGVDNLLMGGKSIAVTHIANALTRVHYGEWSIGAAAGVTAGWLTQQPQTNLTPADIVSTRQIPKLKRALTRQGQRFTW